MAPGRGVMAPIAAMGQAMHILCWLQSMSILSSCDPYLPSPLPLRTRPSGSPTHNAVRSHCSSPWCWDGAREAPTAPGGRAQVTMVLKSTESL